MKKSEKQNRRKFLSLGLLSGVALLTQEGKAQSQESSANDEESVMLLTSDGKLVEVKKSIIQKGKLGKVTNQEILNWTNTPKAK